MLDLTMVHVRRVLRVFVPWLVLLGACTVPNPKVSDSTSGTTTGTASGTSGTSSGPTATSFGTAAASSSTTGGPDLPPACEPDGVCLPAAPADWEGPIVVLSGPGADPPTCAAPWSDQLLEAGTDVVAPPATCDCACDPPEGGTCGDVTVKRFGNNSCVMLPTESFTIPPGACDDNGGAGFPAGSKWLATVSEYMGGSCTPQATEQVDPPTWQTAYAGCVAQPAEGMCADGTHCHPPLPPDAVACIYREGNVPCPVDMDYTDRTVVYRSIDDTRGCAPCTCGDPEGACSATVRFALGNCVGGILLLAHAADGTCFDGPSMPADKISISTAEPQATCTPSPPLAEGEATAADPVTLCCL